TQSARLGYALDSRYYGIPEFNDYVKAQLAKLTLADVNDAIRRHLKSDRMRIVLVTKNTDTIRDSIVKNTPSPITNISTKANEIIEEIRVIQAYHINVKPEDIVIVPVAEVFQ